MGYNVEFKRVAYKWNEDEWTKYLLFAYYGDSNLRNHDGTMAKDWVLLAHGHQWEVMRKVCDFAAMTEGGMLKYKNGDTKPENYIKNWRKTLDEAKPLRELNAHLKVYLEEDELRQYEKQTLSELREHPAFIEGESRDKTYIGVRTTIELTQEDEIVEAVEKYCELAKSERMKEVRIIGGEV